MLSKKHLYLLPKYILQTITGITAANFPNNTLRDELALIEENKHLLSGYHYELSKKLTTESYLAVYRIKNALKTAYEKHEIKNSWLHAYEKACQADAAITALVEYKLNKINFHDHSDINQVLFNIILASFVCYHIFFSSGLFTVLHPNSSPAELQKEESKSFVIYLFLLTLLELHLIFRFTLNKNKAVLAAVLVDQHWRKTVLLEAKKLGIEIDVSEQIREETHPWSYEQLLENIGCKDIPEEFYCPISLTVMNQPVFFSTHKASFDKAFIHEWLRKKNTHPLTQETVFEDELILDTVLEEKIANFTHEKTKNFISSTIIPSLLETIEMRSEDEFSVELNQCSNHTHM